MESYLMKNLVMAVSLLLLLAGCSSSNVTTSWAAKNVQQKQFKKILVLGLFNDKDRALREQIEQRLTAQLQGEHFEIMSSIDEYGPKSFEGLDEEKALKRLRTANVDGVITVTLLDKEKEKNYVPGNVSYQPYAMRYNRFWGYYQTYYTRVYDPGYYTSSTKYVLETSLYDVKNNSLVYSAQSETFDPSSPSNLADEYTKVIINDMKKKNVLS
jgi:hypothetical protein